MAEINPFKSNNDLNKKLKKAKTLKEIFQEGDKSNLDNVLFDNFCLQKKKKEFECFKGMNELNNKKVLVKEGIDIKFMLNLYLDQLQNDDLIMEHPVSAKSKFIIGQSTIKSIKKSTSKKLKRNHSMIDRKVQKSKTKYEKLQYKQAKTSIRTRSRGSSGTGSNKQNLKRKSIVELYTLLDNSKRNSNEMLKTNKIGSLRGSKTKNKINSQKSDDLNLDLNEKDLNDLDSNLINKDEKRVKTEHDLIYSKTINNHEFNDKKEYLKKNVIKSKTKLLRSSDFEYLEMIRQLKKTKRVDDSISNDEDELENNLDLYSTFLIDPESYFKFIWDLLIFVIILYSLLFCPYFIAFPTQSTLVHSVEACFDLMFLCDIILGFFIAFYNDEEKLIMNHNYIIQNYLRGWFLIDLLSTIPGNSIYFITLSIIKGTIDRYSNQNYISVSILKFFRFLKLFKMMNGEENTFIKIIDTKIIEELNIHPAIKRIFKFTVSFLIIIHIFTCLWIYFSTFSQRNWISVIGMTNSSAIDIYVASIYFIFTTILTVGYGDIVCTNIYEKVFNILLMSVGVCLYSFGVTSISSLVTNYDSVNQRFFKNLEILEEIRKKYTDMDQNLYEKLIKFIKYDFKFNKVDNFAFVSDLPSRTRNCLLYRVYKKMISNYSFFKYSNKFNSDDFNSKIVLSMRPIRLYKGDVVMREGETISEMILISEGVISAELGQEFNKARILDLRKNDHFGDLLALSNTPCPMNLRVKSKVCEAYIIKKSDLIQIRTEFPIIFEEISRVSTENFNRYQRNIEEIKEEFLETNSIRKKSQGNIKKAHLKVDTSNIIEGLNNIVSNDFRRKLIRKSTCLNNKTEEKKCNKLETEETNNEGTHDDSRLIKETEFEKKNSFNEKRFEKKESFREEIQIKNSMKIKLSLNNEEEISPKFSISVIKNNFSIVHLSQLSILGEEKKIDRCICKNNKLKIKSTKSCDDRKNYFLRSTSFKEESKNKQNLKFKVSQKSLNKKKFLIENPHNKRLSCVGMRLNFLHSKPQIRKKSFFIAESKTKAIINETKENVEIYQRVEKDPKEYIKSEINRIEKKINLQNNDKMSSLIEKLDDILQILRNKQ